MKGANTMTVKDLLSITCTDYQEIRINEYINSEATGNKWIIEKGSHYARIIPEEILNREVIVIVPYYSGISVEIESPVLHTYSIKCTEIYSKTYEVEATSYEKAKDKLIDDIANGREKTPDECVNRTLEFIDVE